MNQFVGPFANALGGSLGPRAFFRNTVPASIARIFGPRHQPLATIPLPLRPFLTENAPMRRLRQSSPSLGGRWLWGAVLAALLCSPAGGIERYVAYQLPTMEGVADGSGTAKAWDISNSGFVVGVSGIYPIDVPYVLGGGRIANPLSGDGSEGRAFAINENGEFVGYKNPPLLDSTGYSCAARFSGASVVELMQMQPHSIAYALNDFGLVVGCAGNGGAASWKNGAMTYLGELDNDRGEARAVNNSGLIAGLVRPLDGPRAFSYADGVMRVLGTLGGASSAAYGVNESGAIVGEAEGGDGRTLAVRFDEDRPVALGVGGTSSRAWAVNNRGQIVGSMNIGGTNHPFLYESGVVRDLLPEVLRIGLYDGVATSINDLGQIVGHGSDGDRPRAFLLAPEAAKLPLVSTEANAYCFAHVSDGSEGAPRFNFPCGIGRDSRGVLYVADQCSGAVRKVYPNGSVTTLASCFDRPFGLAVSNDGVVFVSDMSRNTISRIAQDGSVQLVSGRGPIPGSEDGPLGVAAFHEPRGIALDRAGNLFVADSRNHVIRKIATDGLVSTIAGLAGVEGSSDGGGGAARFSAPQGVAVDREGSVFVADTVNHTIRKIRPDGTVSTIAGLAGTSGRIDALGEAARFDYPAAVTVSDEGNLFVTEFGNHAVRRIDPAGNVSSFSGRMDEAALADGSAAEARFGYSISGICHDSSGNLYLSETTNHLIRSVSAIGWVATLAGTLNRSGSVDGLGVGCALSGGFSVCVDTVGNVYFGDAGRSIIQKMAPDGSLTTVAGTLGAIGHADGPGESAQFAGPAGLAVDRMGNLYVADSQSLTIRKVSPAGVVTTIAGAPFESGSRNGRGRDARFCGPMDVAVDGDGNVYVADFHVSWLGFQTSVIRKIDPSGMVTTLAGSYGPGSGNDGVGEEAHFLKIVGITIGPSGDLFAADASDYVVRKITPQGLCTTIAGARGEGGSADGYGADARLGSGELMRDIAADGAGNLYVADEVIRMVRPDGHVQMVVEAFSQAICTTGGGLLVGLASDRDGVLYGISNALLASDRREYLTRGIPGRLQPRIVAQPASAATRTGKGALFSLTMETAKPVDYRWESSRGGVFWDPVTDGGTFRGAKTNRLEVANADLSIDGVQFRCVASNSYGTRTSRVAGLRVYVSEAPEITASPPRTLTVVAGQAGALSVEATGVSSYQWYKSGAAVAGATNSSLAFVSVGGAEAGIYDVSLSGLGGDTLSAPVVVGVVPAAGQRTAGAVSAYLMNIQHPKGQVYDQFLLTGTAGTFTAAPDKIARCSFLDPNGSIVQVEMSGPGAITVNLANATGPMAPALYNQSGIQYMKGKATIILAGADASTHFTIYSVGTATNPGVTRPDVTYAGWADVAAAGIISTDGALGGIHQGNANYNAALGYTGIYAPNVTTVGGAVVVHGIASSATAQPYLYFGPGGSVKVKIAGSDLAQPSGDSITVGGLAEVQMGAGQDSCGRGVGAKAIQCRLVNDAGIDVTSAVVVP